jgi:hypothetical protein
MGEPNQAQKRKISPYATNMAKCSILMMAGQQYFLKLATGPVTRTIAFALLLMAISA